MGDAAAFIAPALLVAYLAVGGVLLLVSDVMKQRRSRRQAAIIDALTVAACQYRKDAEQAADLALHGMAMSAAAGRSFDTAPTPPNNYATR
jgi:hypothetical protein